MSLSARVALAIKVEMVRQRINPAALAERIDHSYQWLYRRLNGKAQLGIDDAQLIAHALGTTVEDLIESEPAAA